MPAYDVSETPILDTQQIEQLLPHRHPFLLVDKIISMSEKEIVGLKNVTYSDHFFKGHFPGNPIMPGVLQIESLAQASGVLFLKHCRDRKKNALLLSVDKAKFRRQVVPGDQLRLEIEAIRIKERTGAVRARSLVDGHVAVEAIIRFIFMDV